MAGCHNIHAPLRAIYCSSLYSWSKSSRLVVQFCVLCSMLNSFFSLISILKASTLCLSCNNGFLDLTENTLSLDLYPKHGHPEVTLLVILAIRVRLRHSHKDKRLRIKVVRSEGLGCKREYNMCENKILDTIYSTFLPWCCLPFVHVVF